jgi:hypothetical protein
LQSYTEQYTGTITGVTAGKGLTGGATSENATLNVGAGAGISVGDDAVAVNIKDTTKNSKAAVKGGNSDKLYAVELDSNGKLAVSVPWTATTFEGNDELEALLEPFALKTDLDAYKTKQTAKPSPTTTNSTSTEFIDTISQDANGIITATKKKLPTYTNVTDATVSDWGYMKKTAADSAYAAKSTVTELGNKTITIADKPISLGGSLSRADLADALLLGGAAYCDAGDGLSINADAYGSHLNVNPGDGIKIENDNVSLKVASSTELGGIKTDYVQTGRNYPVAVDTDGSAYVNVP